MPQTVLVIDDDNNMRWVIRRALRGRALAQVSALAARPEIVGKSAVMVELVERLPAGAGPQ